MGSRAISAFVAILVCANSATRAGDDSEEGEFVAPIVAAVAVAHSLDYWAPIEPWVHHKMDPAVRSKLEAGFELAADRIREIGQCGDLFARLGADGLEMLKTTLYLPVASYRHEVVVCGRDPSTNSRGADILAYTKVGGAPTWICRNFARVSDDTAAITVIHEALHHAGLKERPHDRMAMSSIEITEVVQKACGF